MSLFRAKEWWSTKLGESGDLFDGALLCTAKFFGFDSERG